MFEQEERLCLLALPEKRFEPVVWKEAKVHRDTHISFDKALYSVPWRWVGKTVLVRGTAHSIQIYGDDERLATHGKVDPGKRSTQEEHLPPHRRDLRHRSLEYWIQRATKIDPSIADFIQEVFDSDDVLEQLRAVQYIVTYLETFPKHRAILACQRASFFGSYSYRSIKNILKKGLDQEPLPNIHFPITGAIEEPRFARNIQEIFEVRKEVIDGYN